MATTNTCFGRVTFCTVVLCLLSAGVCESTVGGWDTKPKPSGKPKPTDKPAAVEAKDVDAPVFPPPLQAAIDKFQKALENDQEALDNATAIRDKKIKALRDAEEPKFHALLKTEVVRLTKMNHLKEAKTCKTLLNKYEPGKVDWAKVPSDRIASSHKRLLLREAAIQRGEQQKILSKKKKLERNAKSNSKPVLAEFEKLISAAEKQADLNAIIKWKQQKNIFQARMPGKEASAADPSLLFSYRFTPKNLFKKNSAGWIRDLSPAKNDGLISKGKIIGSRSAYPHIQFDGSGGIQIPGMSSMTIPTSKNFTLCLQCKINKNKTAMSLACFGIFKDNNGILTSFYDSYYINRSTIKPLLVNQWHSLVLLQKGNSQYFFVNGKLCKTVAAKTITEKPFLIGNDKAYPPFFSLGEARFYARALTKPEIQKFTKDSAPK